MRQLPAIAVRRPWLVLAATLLVVAAAAPGLLRLELRTDGHALVPEDDPWVAEDRAVRSIFPVPDPLIVLVETHHPRGIYNSHTLRLIQRLTGELQAVDGIASVVSLATEHGDRYRPNTLLYQTFLEEFPETPGEMERLCEDVRAIGLYHGTIVSEDETATAILARVARDSERIDLLRRLDTLLGAEPATPDRVSLLGAPAAEALLGFHILRDLGIPLAALGLDDDGPLARSIDAPGPATGGDPDTLAGQGDGDGNGAAWTGLRSMLQSLPRPGMVPLALLVLALVFALAFRHPVAVLLPLVEVGLCLVVVFGIMGWIGVPVFLTTAILPVILAAVGVADEVHVYSHYARARALDLPASAATLQALESVWRPVVKTSLTTALGFLSFALAPIPPVRWFGIFAALGVLLCMLASLTTVPALLVLLAPRARDRQGTGAPRGVEPWLGRRLAALAPLVCRRRWLVVGACATLALTLPFGLGRIVVQDSWVDGFAPGSELVAATRRYEAVFHGSHLLLLCVEAHPLELRGTIPRDRVEDHALRLPGDAVEDPARLVAAWLTVRRALPDHAGELTLQQRAQYRWSSWIESSARSGGLLTVRTPRTEGSPLFWMRPGPEEELTYEIQANALEQPAQVRRIARLEELLRQQGGDLVGGVLGPPDYLETTEFIVSRRDPDARRLPTDPKRLRWGWQQIGRIRGQARLDELVDESRQRGLVTVFLRDADYVAVSGLLAKLHAFEAQELAPHGLRLRLAGDIAVSQALIESIVTTQLRSLAFSLLAILVAAAWLLGSLRLGFLAVLPSALGVAALFATLGYAGIPLGVATSMFAGMLLGIGVDFAIHLLERHRVERVRGADPTTAWIATYREVGPAVVVNGIAVTLGLGVLIFSQVPANARLGMLSATGVLVCLLVSLLLVPALGPLSVALSPSTGETPSDPDVVEPTLTSGR